MEITVQQLADLFITYQDKYKQLLEEPHFISPITCQIFWDSIKINYINEGYIRFVDFINIMISNDYLIKDTFHKNK